MFLEYWMIGVVLLVWAVSLWHMWMDGLYNGIEKTFTALEHLDIIELTTDEEGNQLVKKKE